MKKLIAEPLRVRRLSEVVETHLRDVILGGETEPGERLPTEKQLSEQFGVSMVTAREALKGLEMLGLVERKKGKGGGIFVREMKSDALKLPLFSFFSAKKVSSQHLTELRTIVEPAAVRLAAAHITEREIKVLENNIRYCEQKIKSIGDIFSEAEFFEIEEKNVEFHRLIAEATHNPVLALTVDYLMDFLFTYKKKTLEPDLQFSKGTIRDHRRILTYVKQGDAEGAARKMDRHLVSLQRYFGTRGV